MMSRMPRGPRRPQSDAQPEIVDRVKAIRGAPGGAVVPRADGHLIQGDILGPGEPRHRPLGTTPVPDLVGTNHLGITRQFDGARQRRQILQIEVR